MRSISCAVGLVLVCGGVALGQEPPAPGSGAGTAAGGEGEAGARGFFAAGKDEWTLQFEPAAWYVAPGGKIRTPGTPTSVDRAELADLNLDSSRFTPFGELHLRSEDWRVTVSGFAFSESDRGATQVISGQIGSLVYGPGDRLVSSLDIAAFEASAGYTWHPAKLQGDQFKASIEALGGARFYNVDFKVSGAGGSSSEEQLFGHPFVGAKLSMNILRDFTIDVQLDAGYFPSGDGSATGYDVLAGFMWRPVDNVGVQIGYRDLAFFLESGSGTGRFTYDGALQGLYVGAVVRF